MANLEKVLAYNGVMVLLLHPEYFDLFGYLINPKNFFVLLGFVPTYLARVFKLKKNQWALELSDRD